MVKTEELHLTIYVNNKNKTSLDEYDRIDKTIKVISTEYVIFKLTCIIEEIAIQQIRENIVVYLVNKDSHTSLLFNVDHYVLKNFDTYNLSKLIQRELCL